MILNQENILQCLSNVQEPDLGKDLVTLKMIIDIKIESKQVSFTLLLTTPACPLKDKMEKDCIDEIQKVFGSDMQVKVNFEARVTSSRNNIEILPKVKNIVLVTSGKGGVGKSTVALNLALALKAEGASVGILDADIYGPSIPIMMGLQNARPEMKLVGEKHLILPIEKDGIKCMSIGFLIDEAQAVAWRGPMVSSALRQLLTDVIWDELDYLVIDMPPGTGDIHLTMSQLVKVSGAIVVTTPQEVAVADAIKGANMYMIPQVGTPLIGVVENMSWFTPKEMPDNKYYIFGKGGGEKIANRFGVDLLAQLPMSMYDGEYKSDSKFFITDLILKPLYTQLAQKVAQKMAMNNAKNQVES